MVSAESKKRRRKEGQKRKKAARVEVPLLKEEKEQDVEVVIVGLDEDDKEYEHFKDVFSKMQPKEGDEDASDDDASSDDEIMKEEKANKGEPVQKGLSKKEQRQCKRFTVAQLKQVVSDPGVVEFHDTNSPDPKLLVHLKACRNTVPIPRHWCHKRKYLSRKRGGAKPPFELPANIAATGVSRIREAQLKQEQERRDRKQSADKSRMKLARIDMDFGVMQEAFHRRNVGVPPLLGYGEIYYEGVDAELKYKKLRPGVLSDKLKRALGMPDDDYPPPWLTNMQKYGPPRSYPALRVPGLTHPIPAGASFGFGPGQWGKVPVNPDTGKPLYGDVFGHPQAKRAEPELWGQVVSDDESEVAMDEEPMPQEEEGLADAATASAVPMSEDDLTDAGAASIAGLTSAPTETPAILDLRKAAPAAPPQQAYQVLETGGAPAAGAYGYKDSTKQSDVAFSLTEVEMERLQAGDTSVIKDRFQAHEGMAARERDHISDAFAEEAARRGGQKDAGKKKKDFKF